MTNFVRPCASCLAATMMVAVAQQASTPETFARHIVPGGCERELDPVA